MAKWKIEKINLWAEGEYTREIVDSLEQKFIDEGWEPFGIFGNLLYLRKKL